MTSLLYLNSCKSTQDEIISIISDSPSAIAGVYTCNQTQGRGQYGNTWEQSDGKNLALSVAIKAPESLSGTDINFYTAVLVRDFVANLTDTPTYIKWPNDIILKGKKIVGILLEKEKISGTDYFIIGTGLNILQENFENYPKAGSLLTQSGKRFSPQETAEKLYQCFLDRPLAAENPASILAKINQHLFKKDEVAVFRIQNKRQNGIIQHVDAQGFLWVNLEEDGLQKFFHKEIEMLY